MTGEKLRKIRRSEDISQIDLAKQMKCTQALISMYESGTKSISDKRVEQYIKAIEKLKSKKKKK